VNSQLLRLPPEIRQQIFGYVFNYALIRNRNVSDETFPHWGFYPGGGEIILACRQIYEDCHEILGFMLDPTILELDCIVYLKYVRKYFKQLDCTKIQELVCGPRLMSIMVAHQSDPSMRRILEKDIQNLLKRFPALKEITVVADLSDHSYFTPEEFVDKEFGLDTAEWGLKINIRKTNDKAANQVSSRDRALGLICSLLPGANSYHPLIFSLAQLRARLEGPQRGEVFSAVGQSTGKESMQIDRTGSPFLNLPTHIRNAIYAHAFSTAHTHAIYNPNSNYMSRCTIVEDGTSLLLVSRQLNAEATPYKHTYIMLVVSKPLYFPEFVSIKKAAKSDRITTVRLPILMVMAMYATIYSHEPREAAWPKDKVVEDAFSGLECVEVSRDKVNEEERKRIYVALKKALAENKGVKRAIRIAFCRLEVLVRIYDKTRLG
jgi:hypothetical protein